MDNRGPDRGVLQQAAPLAERPEGALLRRWPPPQPVRPGPEPGTAPRPYRRDTPAYRPPSPADIRATVPVTQMPAPAQPAPVPPVERQRPPGGIALDNLEEQDTEVPAKFSKRSLLSRFGLGREAHDRALRDRVRASVDSAFPIAVLNLKGGVGKTTVVEALGSTFASARDDPVIAVDVDAGDLADRHGRVNALTLVDLLAGRPVTRYPDVRAHTCRNVAGLEVLGLPDYAHRDWLIERDDVVKAFSILRKHYSVVLMDCGKMLKSPVMEAVLLESRALVVVTSASVDAIKKTRATLAWLAKTGYQKRIESTVLAINHTERAKPNAVVNRELQKLSAQFTPKRMVVLPFDQHVHDGNEITLEWMSKQSRRRYLEMAATLADMFPRRDVGKSARASA
ncbi:MAG: MinD/ParA family ATP-binding protein [Mycobacterium sp.]